MPHIIVAKAGADLPVTKLAVASFSRADILAAIRAYEGDQPERPSKLFRGYFVQDEGGQYLGIFSTLDA